MQPDSHLEAFPIGLTTIYDDHLVAKCAPLTIFHNSKSGLHLPNIGMVSTIVDIPNLTHQPVKESDEIDKDQLNCPNANAATATSGYNGEQSYRQYTPTRCNCCGLTQKECHQQWSTLHDAKDPTTCPFRGPEFIKDKQIRERVLQYNLKHGGNHNNSTTEDKKNHI